MAETARHFMIRQAEDFQREGLDLHIFCDGCTNEAIYRSVSTSSGVRLHDVPMSRDVEIARDVRSFRAIRRLMKYVDPDVLMVGTPKAGLLGILAGAVAGVRVRIYIVRGLRLESLSGPSAFFNLQVERIVCRLATHVLSVSPSLRDELVVRRITRRDRVVVLGSGGSNGVDTKYFRPPTESERAFARRTLGVPPGAHVVGFAGRLTPDKGVDDLLAAMREVSFADPRAHLLIAGTVDSVRPLSKKSQLAFSAQWCTPLGHLEDIRTFYWALDVFCLPSYREGMPNASLEAAACGLPVITTRATGCRDSVIDGETGVLVDVGAPDQLASAIMAMLDNADLAELMAKAGRARTVDDFDQHGVWRRTLEFIQRAAGRTPSNGL